MNPTFIIGLVGGLAALTYFLVKGTSVANMIDKLTITPKLNGTPSVKSDGKTVFAKILNVATGSGYLSVPMAIQFGNRSGEEMKVSVQSVMVYYGDSLVAANTPAENGVKIAGNATTTLEGLKMEMPIVKLVSVLGSSVSTLITNGNFNEVLDKLTFKIGLVYNNVLSFDISMKLNEEKACDTTAANKSVSGLGLVAQSERKIGSFYDYAHYLPNEKPQYKDYIVKPNASVFDTVAVMKKIAAADKDKVANLAKHLERETLNATLKNIWCFVYKYVDYVRDSRVREQVRRPLRTLYDQKGDCDCYATLIGSMLTALGVPFKFRIAAYNYDFQHVYVIVPSAQSKKGYFVIDPVLDAYDEEKHPTEYRDL